VAGTQFLSNPGLSNPGPSLIELLIEHSQAGVCAHQALYL
jgi:hypothetical protein